MVVLSTNGTNRPTVCGSEGWSGTKRTRACEKFPEKKKKGEFGDKFLKVYMDRFVHKTRTGVGAKST